MIVTLLEKERIMNLALPNKKKGIFWIRDWDTNDKLISVEAIHGEWIVKSSAHMWFVDDENNRIEDVRLCPFYLYSVKSRGKDYPAHVMVEPDMHLERYRIQTTDDILIGRNRENDICLNSIAVSSIHARISRKKDRWVLFDENSTNGVYVNNCRIHNSGVLKPGDVIYIMGFRMIMGKGFLAVSNPNHMVAVNCNRLAPIRSKILSRKKRKVYNTIDYFIPQMQCIAVNASLEQCIDIIGNEKGALWSCRKEHSQFLNIRVGDETHISLQEYVSIGVKGCMEHLYSFCRGLMIHLITRYSYADVKIVFLSDNHTAKEFHVARWLPHMWDNPRLQSFFVRERCDVESFVKLIKNQHTKEFKSDTEKAPYYIVLGFNRELEKMLYESGLSEDWNIRYFIFLDYNKESFLKYDILLELDNDQGKLSYITENRNQEFVPDQYTETLDMLYLQLANTQIEMDGTYGEHYIVELYVPVYGKVYDVRMPRNDRIGDLLLFIEKQIAQQEKGYPISKGDAILCDREDGIVLDTELTPEESGVLNGTRLMLI